jgi:hypothetical protein
VGVLPRPFGTETGRIGLGPVHGGDRVDTAEILWQEGAKMMYEQNWHLFALIQRRGKDEVKRKRAGLSFRVARRLV